MVDGALPIVVTPEAFGRGAFDLSVVEGSSVCAVLVKAVEAGLPSDVLDRTEVYVNGVRLERETALDYRLKADDLVNIVVEPLGGGGGGRKDVGQILLSVAVIAVSAWVGGGAGGAIASKLMATIAAAAITAGGQALISSLFRPDGRPNDRANDRYALQSASNQYRQWEPMPLALGEVVVAPDLAVKTFTQNRGEDVWIYGILALHYGPCAVADVKIGDTLVSTMGAADFQMVQHLTPGPRQFSLYPNDVDQLDLSEELQATVSSATPMVRALSGEAERVEIDYFLPQGLHFQKDDGRVLAASVSVSVRYRPIDTSGNPTGPWVNAPGLSRSSTTKDPWRITHSFTLPKGRYEIEQTRSRPADANEKRRDQIYVTALRAIVYRKPITDETLSVIEFAVRATAVNQGSLAPITCRITPIAQEWTGEGWSAPRPTSNPAALTRWLMSGPASAKPLDPSEVDVRLRAWSQLCDEYNWTSHVYVTEARTQEEALAILERAGRASLFDDGTQLAAACWVEKPAPRQLFTGANLKDHKWQIAYPEPVHALRVEFANIEKGGEPDHLYVYADGYGEVADAGEGVTAASLVESVRLDGQAHPERAYRDGRWLLGSRLHQRRVDTWSVDVENLACQYGDRVRLAWRKVEGGDVRVRTRRWSGGLVSGLRLSQPVSMEAGQDYAVDLRTVSGLYLAVPIETVAGETREIRFVTPRDPDQCPVAGDLVAFGLSTRVSEDVEIIGIEPGEDLTAVLTGRRYVAPLLMAGETGPIPPLQSRLSLDRSANPPAPTILGQQVDANGVRISFAMPIWRGSPISGFSVRWRAQSEAGEEAGWSKLPALDASAREVQTPPLRDVPVEVEGIEATRVEVEIVAHTLSGRVSDPALVPVTAPVVPAPKSIQWTAIAYSYGEGAAALPGLLLIGPDEPPADARRLIIELVEAEVSGPEEDPTVLMPGAPNWIGAYDGTAQQKRVEIRGLSPRTWYFPSITYESATGLKSQRLVLGKVKTGELVAGGLAKSAAEALLEEALKEVDDKVQDATDLIRDSVNLDDLFEQGDDLAEAILKLGRGLLDVRGMIDRLGRVDGLPVGTVLRQEVAVLDEADRQEAAARLSMGAVLGDNIAAANSAISVVAGDLSAEAWERMQLGVAVALNKAAAESAIGAVATDLGIEVLARETLAGRVGTNEGAIVTERNLRISGDSANASSISALAVTVGNNKAGHESAISALANELGAEVVARGLLSVRVTNAEGAITTEQSVRANADGIFTANFALMGARRGDSSGWVLNKSTVDITDEGTLANVLSGLRATDGANSSQISSLQSASGSHASSLLSLTSTVGGHTSSISALFEVTEGLGSRWTVALNSGGQITGLTADGQTRSWVFAAGSFAVVDDGNGLSYTPATGRLKMVKGTQKTVLGAGSSLILWAGSTAIADGAETVDNGILGIDGTNGSWFGGRTLSGPFDSGAPSATLITLHGWTTIASVTPRALGSGGSFLLQPSFQATLSPADVPPEFPEYGVGWRVISTDLSGGDVRVVGNGGFGGPPNTPNVSYSVINYQLFQGYSGPAGQRQLHLQVIPAGDTPAATVRNGRIKGVYFIG